MPRDFPRSRRIEDQIQRILSEVLRTGMRDPRLKDAYITAVRVSRDLGVAWVYYSVLRTDAAPAPDMDAAFKSAVGFLRGRLAKELTIRRVPELRFERDETISNAAAMDDLIDAAIARERGDVPDESGD